MRLYPRDRSPAFCACVCLFFWLIFGTLGLQAQTLPGASGADDASHGWVIAQVPRETSATLVHLPPRTATGIARPSVAGRMRAASTLRGAPIAMAAHDRTVYLAFAPTDDGPIEINSLSAVPTSVQDHWVRQPRDRLRFLPSVEGADELLGLAHDGAHLVAMVRSGDDFELLQLDRNTWAPMDVQPALDASLELELHSTRWGLVVAERGDGLLTLHEYEEVWRQRELSQAFAAAEAALGPVEIVGIETGDVIGVARADSRAQVVSLREEGWSVLGVIDAPGEPFAATILPSTARLVLVWTEAELRKQPVESSLPGPEVETPVRRVLEFSLIEGRVLYSGPAVVGAPVSVSEFRNLAFLLILIMGLILLVVLRPVPADGEIVLPPGLAIAGPGRRLLATLIDATIGLYIVARLLELSLLEVLGPIAVPQTGSLEIGPLALAIVVNVLHCTFGEAFLGRTFGKWMTGLIVARVDPASASLPAGQFRPPTPIRALGRNLIKWFLPPVSMLALSDPSGRHRGDLVARTAVLCRANEPLSDAD